MNRENVLKSLKINFATAIFAALMAIAAFETGYITKGALAMLLTESDIYYIEVAGIMLTIAIIPAALKLFSRAMSKAVKNDMEKGQFMKPIKRLFLWHKHRKFCKLNRFFCPDCIYHNFVWEDGIIFRGNKCMHPLSKYE